MSGRPGGSKRVRYFGGVREEMVEEEDSDTDSLRYQGLQEATGDQDVQRAIIVKRGSFRACAVCVTVLCVLLAAGIIGISMYYNSAIKELQTNNNMTLDRDQWKTSFDKMTLERDQWKTSFDNMTLERDQWKTSFDNMTLERDQWKTSFDNMTLERVLCGTAVKSCPSGWKTFGSSCYYRSTQKKTWEESKKICLKTGADLVIINSNQEEEFIRLLTSYQSASWIGLKRTAGKWTWVDGTPLTTTQYWARGWPRNDEDSNCASYWYNDGGWGNWMCSHTAYGICEK